MRKFRNWAWGYCLILYLTLLTAHWGSKAVTVMAENAAVNRLHTVIIDAGHGGIDGGATSCTGVLESHINMKISSRLDDLLHFLGYQTKMIRTEDISVYTSGKTIAQKKSSDLKERVRIVNSTDNALLLSIHQNNYPDKRYSGAQVFYSGTEGSQEFAVQLQNSLRKNLKPVSTRQEKHSKGIYLMEHIQCPGVLIECGFLSNPEEEQKLRDREYQQKLCSIIAVCTAEYLSNT